MRRLGLLSLAAAALASLAAQERSETVEGQAVALYTDAIIVGPAAREAEKTFAMDSTDRVAISIYSVSATPEAFLVDPGGAQVRPGTVIDIPAPGSGRSHEFLLTSPAGGLWKFRVRETGPARVAAIFTMGSTSSLLMALAGVGRDYTVGRQVNLGLIIVDDRGGIGPGDATTVRAAVQAGSGPLTPITFADDGRGTDPIAGDGAWSAPFTLNTAGRYQVVVTVAGSRNGRPFMRSAAGTIRVVAACGSFQGPFTSRTVDPNNNRRPDSLELIFTVNAARAGRYQVLATLRASNGKEETSKNITDLRSGPQAVTVTFPVTQLRTLEVNGPYQVSEARLGCFEGESLRACYEITLTSSRR